MKVRPELVKISDSQLGCSACSRLRLELYPDFISKTLEQWEQFIQEQFAAHVRKHHTPTLKS
jgi:hypothetical protein